MLTTIAIAVFALAIGAGLGAIVSGARRRRWYARLHDAERRAVRAERLAEIGSMTGGLAHEIKNPLSTIGLNAQLLAEAVEDLDIPQDERGRLVRRVGSLRREAERLRDILTEFLEFAGEIHLEPRPTDLNALLEELLDFFHPQADAQRVRVHTQFAKGPLTVPLDPQHFKQAALNLLLNAVQAMANQPQGTPRELIIRTARADQPDESPAVRVHFIDTGPGIDPPTLARIFHPYYTTKPGGSGLGLPMTRRIIELHNGHLDAQSEPGRGTEFIITLPAQNEDAESNA